MKAVLALDQGTTSSRAIAFGRDGRILAISTARIPPDLSPARAGWSTTPRKSGARSATWPPRRSPRPGCAAARRRRHRDHQPARDHGPLGPRHRDARSPTRSSGRTDAPRRDVTLCDRPGHEPLFAAQDGPAARRLLLRHQARLAARQRRRARASAPRAASSPSAPSTPGSPGSSPAARAHVTDVSNASRTLLFNIHTLDWDDELLAHPRHPARGAAARGAPRARVVARDRAARACPTGIADRRHRGRPAGGALRPGVPPPGHGEEHLRHRLLPADEHGRQARASRATACSPPSRGGAAGATAYALEGSVFIAGAAIQWLRDGLGIIARASDIDALAASVPDAGGVYFVPALSGLGAPYWDPHARGTIVGHHARHHARAPRARDARGDRLPERRADRGDGGGLGHRAHGAARRRRRHRLEPADADPGRPPRRAGGAPAA